MKKTTAFLVTVLGVLALTGAGCNTDEGANTNEEQENVVATSTPTTEETNTSSTEEVVSQIEATGEVLGEGVVSIKWTVPENFDKTKSFQVLHSSKPNPEHPSAFWFQYMNSARTTELSNIAVGKRYFRVCAFDLTTTQCTSYSNELELDVK